MSTIIAGHFQLQEDTNRARDALLAAGFPVQQISTFFVNPPGQHHTFELGGDRDKSPGAKETDAGIAKGVATGGAVGAVIGAVSAPVTGPLGAVVGALVGGHVGSLYSFSHMKEAGEAEPGSIANQVEQRPSGMLVAVALPETDDLLALEQRAIDVLRQQGAHHIEEAEGTIVDGDWQDFNPLSLPVLVTR
jgi:hypothetical protein